MDLRTSSREFVLEFINCLRNSPCLWQTTYKEYKSKASRLGAYVKLLNILKKYEPGSTIDHVKKKLQSLRASHRKERKKVMNSMRTDSGQDVYRPKLWYYKELHFLNDQEESSTSMSTLDSNLNEDENLNQSSTQYFDGLQDRDEEEQVINNKTNSETENNSRMEHINLASSSQGTQRKRNIVEETMPSFVSSHKKSRTKLDVLNRTISNLRDIFASIETNETDESDNDECITFGKYVGLQLRKLSSEKRICTQSSIHNLLSEALLSEIRDRVRSSTSLSGGTSHTDESYSDQNVNDFVTTQYN